MLPARAWTSYFATQARWARGYWLQNTCAGVERASYRSSHTADLALAYCW